MLNNLITDVKGLRVGHAHDDILASGVTCIIFDQPSVASISIQGGAPGIRDTALLEPEMTINKIDGIVLSGGSSFGLDASGGVQAWLREQNRGQCFGGVLVPLVPQAILFDLNNGGNKNWGKYSPYLDLGYKAASVVSAGKTSLGTVGAGYGATTANLKGGLGSASTSTTTGIAVGSIVAVNALGSTTVGNGPHFWAATQEVNQEYGGLGYPSRIDSHAVNCALKRKDSPSTTIALVATDAQLTKSEAKRVAIMAHDGIARALRPAHAPYDGDLIFVAATGYKPLSSSVEEITEIGICAADCISRSIARAIYEAVALPFTKALPAWKDKFIK